ncbi:CPBP family intramembrane glutamic endopeptidase [Lentilactobacillus parafarraginis]|nr:CPBP family intramembrane glutamic endopeptidase [Lentilactobacillus parafarraginis]
MASPLHFWRTIADIIMVSIMTIIWIIISQLTTFLQSNANTPINDWLFMMGEIVGVVAMIFTYRRSPDIMTFSRDQVLKRYITAFLAGTLAFASCWLISVGLGGFTVRFIMTGTSAGWAFLFLIGFAIQGLFEELVCRGYIMGHFLKRHQPLLAIIVNVGIFAALHSLNAGIDALAVVNLILFGLFMSLMRYKWQNLWINGAFHSAWNFAEGVLFGTAVSGTVNVGAVFKSVPVIGKALINGGTFGIENTVICTGIYLVMAAWLSFTYRDELRRTIVQYRHAF